MNKTDTPCNKFKRGQRNPSPRRLAKNRDLAKRAVNSVELKGPLADLPEHVKEVVRAYAELTARSALLHSKQEPR